MYVKSENVNNLNKNYYINYIYSKFMFVIIEASIGAGKTTLLDNIKSHYDVIYECVDKWIEEKMLEKFYQEHITAFDFQKYVVNTMYERLKNIEENEQKIYIVERSLLSSIIFSNVLHKDKKISDLELKRITDLVNALNKKCKYIYLKTDYNICSQRINKRARNEENNIPLEYLKKLEDEHDEQLLNNKDLIGVVDGNNNMDIVLKDVLKIIDNIKN